MVKEKEMWINKLAYWLVGVLNGTSAVEVTAR
jgi:hypothetical protein